MAGAPDHQRVEDGQQLFAVGGERPVHAPDAPLPAFGLAHDAVRFEIAQGRGEHRPDEPVRGERAQKRAEAGRAVFEGAKSREIVEDPVEYVRADLEIQEKGVPLLRDCMATVADDPLTYDILKDYLADEEEDLYWLRGQLELYAKIGLQNYLPTLI